MNLRKFIATNTRDCLRIMREALGADAMIVSTRKTADGVEIVGASAQEVHDVQNAVLAPATVAPQRPSYSVPAPIGQDSGSDNDTGETGGRALWDEIEDEPVRLSPAARVLAQQSGTPAWPRMDEDQAQHVVRSNLPQASRPQREAVHPEPERPRVRPIAESGSRVSETEQGMRETLRQSQPSLPVAASHSSPEAQPAAAPAISPEDAQAIASAATAPVMEEMRAMREWMSQQMGALTWRDATHRNPMRRNLWRTLVDSGFSPVLARTILARLPDDYAEAQAEQWLREVLVRNLRTVPLADSIVEKGGIYAIVGPTGVGKTTTTAKIAARCVVKYGARSLGLITTDQYRIGAVDQLRTFGRILGVDVYTARGAQDLESTLLGMSDRKLVLVDTTGMSQRDERIPEHLQSLAVTNVQRLLVLPGGAHAEQAEDIVQAYRGDGLAGAIISKLDEAVRLGGPLDAAIRHQLPLHFLTTGQRVPEDLHGANIQLLVHRALKQRGSSLFELEGDELDWSSMPAVDAPSGNPARVS
ncbi:flagellar biosynthesis protein FlhF [Pigmentiphaga aceris]|uniref:Flagellar biosynthesis protein FlhF n=1 Tax=Pigmentiphaga aceris TaxID=1940612 RepID=A0A5C0AXX8_9BURK|nr:flagellar biosynthesis protein FlhF [Pigmentiphaga aceris]QEI07228.1 flagellar biosynthesis protein FlhF [Pigmentiphaga aceris]